MSGISRRSLGWSIISLSSISQGTSCPWKQYLYHLSVCYQLNMCVCLCVGEKDLHHFLTLFYCAGFTYFEWEKQKVFLSHCILCANISWHYKEAWKLGKLLKRKNFALCFTGGEVLLFVSDIHYCFLITFGNNNTILFLFRFLWETIACVINGESLTILEMAGGTTHEQLIINIPHPMGIIVPPGTIQCSRHTRKLLESSQNTWVILAKSCSQEISL